jgi:ABC-type multidrug transport system ATPase subunit
MGQCAVRVSQVSLCYFTRPILKNLELEVEAGSRVALIGPNGVGKTTLLSVIAGATAPLSGEVEIFAQRRRSSVETERLIRQQTFFLPDNAWLPNDYGVAEFLECVAKLYQVRPERIVEHVPQLLHLFGMESLASHSLETLSAGQRKKIALCSALVSEAPLLLLDEPFSGGLDPAGMMALESVLNTCTQGGKRTVIFSTPVPEVLETTADRIVILGDAGIRADYPVAEIKQLAGTRRFSTALQELVFPETTERIQQYLGK